jgi:hypothetical protein
VAALGGSDAWVTSSSKRAWSKEVKKVSFRQERQKRGSAGCDQGFTEALSDKRRAPRRRRVGESGGFWWEVRAWIAEKG